MGYRVDLLLNNVVEKQYTELWDVNLSSHKLSGTSLFINQPQRLKVSMFSDDWFYPLLLYSNQIENLNVSSYLLKLYKDYSLIFSGFIDISQIKYDRKTDIINFTAYDYIYIYKLFQKLEGESETNFEISTPGEIIDFITDYNSKIRSEMGITSLAAYTQQSYQSLVIDTTRLNHYSGVDFWKEMKELKPSLESCHSSAAGSPSTLLSGNVSFIDSPYLDDVRQAQIIIWGRAKTAGHNEVTGNLELGYFVLMKIYQYYNYCCWEEREDLRFEETYPIVAGNSSQLASYNDVTNKLSDYGLNQDSSFSYYVDNNGVTHWSITDRESFCGTANEPHIGCAVDITGNVRNDLLSIDSEKTGVGEYTYNYFKTLKALLAYYSYTIYASSGGTINLDNKGHINYGNYDTIEVADIISYQISNLNLMEKINLSELDYLKGNSERLIEILGEEVRKEYINMIEISIVINDIDKYSLVLNQYIYNSDNSNYYKITEIRKDYEKDEYIIKGLEV